MVVVYLLECGRERRSRPCYIIYYEEVDYTSRMPNARKAMADAEDGGSRERTRLSARIGAIHASAVPDRARSCSEVSNRQDSLCFCLRGA
jgi:hypothetical protein